MISNINVQTTLKYLGEENGLYEIYDTTDYIKEFIDEKTLRNISEVVNIMGVENKDGTLYLEPQTEILIEAMTNYVSNNDSARYTMEGEFIVQKIKIFDTNIIIDPEVNILESVYVMDNLKITGGIGLKSLNNAFSENLFEHIDISELNTHNVKDFSEAFRFCFDLSEVYLNIDASNAEKMISMFVACECLTKVTINIFNAKHPIDMNSMFKDCTHLKKVNILGKNIYVSDMTSMFENCPCLEYVNLSAFNTSQVKSMKNMFMNCYSLKSVDFSSFDTAQVESMENMFYNCSSLESMNLCSFNTSKVEIMCEMFRGCKKLRSLNLSSFNTENVKDMIRMFYDCFSLASLDLRHFQFCSDVNLYEMFAFCKCLTLKLPKGLKDRKTDVYNMLRHSSKNLDLKGF